MATGMQGEPAVAHLPLPLSPGQAGGSRELRLLAGEESVGQQGTEPTQQLLPQGLLPPPPDSRSHGNSWVPQLE